MAEPNDDTALPDPWEVAQVMWANDRAAESLGIDLVEVEAGRSVARLVVRDDMLNGLGVCHGGVVFTLADVALAYSSNSFNQRAVATQAEIDLVASTRAGAVLTATAIQRHQRGKSAITDVEVVDQDGTVIALFRGRTLQVPGHHIA